MEKNFNELRSEFMSLLEENLKNNKDRSMILELAQEVCKKPKGSGKRKDSKSEQLKKLILDQGKISIDDVWDKFKWGNHETLSTVWLWRNKALNPEEKIWVQREGDFYVLRGVGAEQPESWIERKKKSS